MWKRLQDCEPYYLLFTKDQNYNVSITNYKKVWNVVFDENELISWLKDNNSALEIDSNELLANGVKLLLQPEKLKSAIVTNEERLLKVTVSRNFGYPLKLVMILQLGSHDVFFKLVTQSLLKTIQDLRCSETTLRDLLKCKDKEIEEYKAEAGEVVLRYLKTKPFNDIAHMEKYTVYEVNFGNLDLPTSLLQDTHSHLEKKPSQPENVPKLEVKTEPESEPIHIEVQAISNDVKIKTEHMKREPIIAPKKRKLKINL